MNKNLLLILVIFAGPALAHAQTWQQKVNYSIDVTLTDSTHSLDGFIHIHYFNHSPDTLSYIWIRCWPNAFKNDRTAFSEQLIRTGRTDFYFSDKTRKGYLNQLEFRVNGQLARMEDHPQYIDVIKVILPSPLPPGDSASLTTPFHVQLPDNFAHCGYHQGVYEVTQWYPRTAVYDTAGWHADPYLGPNISYNEFGDFDVRITVPANFAIAASGQPQSLSSSHSNGGEFAAISPSSPSPTSRAAAAPPISFKTWQFRQTNIADFAWFASRRFQSTHDTLGLPSGRIIDLYAYYQKSNSPIARYSIKFLKDALRLHSKLIGDYPFSTATVVETRLDADHPARSPDAGSSYPAIIAVDAGDSVYSDLDMTIEGAIGDQWFAIAIGANGRRYPWMTAGIGQYYYNRYRREFRYPLRKFPIADTFHRSAVNTRIVLEEDQPISTSTEDFIPDNYPIIARYKTAIWMLDLERSLGGALFDSCMHEYFREQQFHHTGPADLKAAFTAVIHRDPIATVPHLNLDSVFSLLDKRNAVPPSPYHRRLEPNAQFVPHPTHHNSLNISPAVGFNNYDHAMVGLLIHNFNLPPDNWQLLAAPLYATASHQWNGLLHFNYAWYPHRTLRLIEAGINGSRFSTISGTDSNGHAIFGGFYKIVPYLRVFFPQPIGSTVEVALEGKTFLIGEKSFDNYVQKSADTGLFRPTYPVAGKYDFRYLNQLAFSIRDNRVLYPWSVNAQVQQARQWYRINLDLHYFFNYASTGGLAVRLFGAKFGYLGTRTQTEDLTQYQPQLTAVLGGDDYTYGNYFIGRNDFTGLASQQIMLRDGDLKLRADQFPYVTGRSDDWVASINLNSSLPPQIVPGWLPLHLFLDVGTYAGAWSDNSATSHFLYVGGPELDLFHNVLRIYAPLVNSSDFSVLKTDSREHSFLKRISFSIDFQNIPFRKYFGYTPF